MELPQAAMRSPDESFECRDPFRGTTRGVEKHATGAEHAPHGLDLSGRRLHLWRPFAIPCESGKISIPCVSNAPMRERALRQCEPAFGGRAQGEKLLLPVEAVLCHLRGEDLLRQRGRGAHPAVMLLGEKQQ